MKNTPEDANAAVGLFIIGGMTNEEFEAWLEGEKVKPAKLRELDEAVARFEAIPIKNKIADLKRRLAERQKQS